MGNIEDCIRTISDPTYDGNKVHMLEISPEQAKLAYDFQMLVWKNANKGNSIISEDAFKAALYEIFGGKEFEKQVEDINTDISKAIKPNVNPFCSMIFNAPQLATVDVGFLGLVCHPELLQHAVKRADLVYNGRFSKITDNANSNIQFVVMDEAQLKLLGTKVVDTLTRSPVLEADDLMKIANTHEGFARTITTSFDAMKAQNQASNNPNNNAGMDTKKAFEL